MTQTTRRDSDHQVKTTVTNELSWTATVNADQIGVSVNNGVVTISGDVDTYPERTAAVAAALRVSGVTSVADEITVRPRGGLDDIGIADHAKRALDTTASVPHTVQATVHEHHVTLTGTVQWNYQRNVVRRLMAEIPGVRSVHNGVVVVPHLPFAAKTAEKNIRAAFVRNAQVDADHIHVTTTGTEIELTGSARTWAERKEAADVAWNTPGVTNVHNNIRINP